MSILRKKNGVSRLWWWNRFVTWFYHLTHGMDTSFERDFDHLNECVHCREKFKKFEKWRAREDRKNNQL